jgi:uncharacterized membrane protein YjjP (DUF1212 family)
MNNRKKASGQTAGPLRDGQASGSEAKASGAAQGAGSSYAPSPNPAPQMEELCLMAGEIMLRMGAETQRAEDTMERIAASFGYPHAQSYVTPTGILFNLEKGAAAKFVRISERSTDLQKVAQVNQVSREIAAGRMTAEQALAELKRISAAAHAYPVWVQLIAAACASGCFLIIFGGGRLDFPAAFAAGGVGYAVFLAVQRWVGLRFFAEFMASLTIGLIAWLAVGAGWGSEMDKIIIGSVMPLVPGLLITNAIRDLMAGHLVSTLSKGADAFLTALAIGTGIAVVLATTSVF